MTADLTVAPPTTAPLLSAEHVNVTFKLSRGRVLHAVNDVSFEIAPGETLALVGESGSGKSTTARAVMNLLAEASGVSVLDGRDLLALKGSALRSARSDIQMIFQDPYSSLDPSMMIGDSIEEPMRFHTDLNAAQRRERVLELLEHVGLRRDHVDRYPHEFSGGQRQRIAIARAIAVQPKLVVADEAVSALDVSTQNQIIRLMERLSDELGIGYLFISHDLAVVRHIADRVAVMYLGRIVEIGEIASVFAAPQHPYTEALLGAALVANPRQQRERRAAIVRGDLPDPTDPPAGCPFNTRCPKAMDVCRTVLPLPRVRPGGGEVACHLGDPSMETGEPTAR